MSDIVSELIDYFKDYGRKGICVAFSGGLCSAVILRTAAMAKMNVHAVTFKTALHSAVEMRDAKKLSKAVGVPHKVFELSEAENRLILKNHRDSLYKSRYSMYAKMKLYANQNGLGLLTDGTNVDDLMDGCAWLKVLTEMNIRTPLADLCIDDELAIEIAEELKIPMTGRSSASYLTERIGKGTEITPALTKKIQRGENFLQDLGFEPVIMKIRDNIVIIEIQSNQFQQLAVCSQKIVKKIKGLGFDYVTLDVEGIKKEA
ncbi:MAG: 7-cyano-7-deazaguanine synthase [Oscillospiraceae bacterium]|jgi:uncharacterized protein|nr:7-cyano-7-deazaguanine synthase [Oscillospiraceae bacterium]